MFTAGWTFGDKEKKSDAASAVEGRAGFSQPPSVMEQSSGPMPDSGAQSDIAAKPLQSVSPADPSVSPVTQAIVNNGVLSCASRVNQITNFLTAGMESGAAVFLSQKRLPETGIMSVSYEINRPDGTTMYASTGFAPGAEGCPAFYETVEFGKASCSDIQARLFGRLSVAGRLKNNIVFLEAGKLRIFLMPAGDSGCVVIKKEIAQ